MLVFKHVNFNDADLIFAASQQTTQNVDLILQKNRIVLISNDAS